MPSRCCPLVRWGCTGDSKHQHSKPRSGTPTAQGGNATDAQEALATLRAQSYIEQKPQSVCSRASAVWTRLELATPCVTGMYSNLLNYQTKADCSEKRCKGMDFFLIMQHQSAFFLKKLKFTLPYALWSRKLACAPKLYLAECSSTIQPLGASRPWAMTRSGSSCRRSWS